jgi:hypothetical protein
MILIVAGRFGLRFFAFRDSLHGRVFVRKYPNRFARIIDGETVDFEGKQMPINAWGQMMTGWPSINIYESVVLERTGQPLKGLRKESPED